MIYLVDSDWGADYLNCSFLHPTSSLPQLRLSIVGFLLPAIAGTSNASQTCSCSSRVAVSSHSSYSFQENMA